MKQESNKNTRKRRTFLKSLSATAVAGGLGGVGQVGKARAQAQATTGAAAGAPYPLQPPAVPSEYLAKFKANEAADLHICRGLNTKPVKINEKNYDVGQAPETNIPQSDLHGCAGGNTCAGLGGCGTGDYATQYWASENLCGRSGSAWTGSGGCGVPVGSTNTGFICSQMNNAVPTPDENKKGLTPVLVGVPVWAIARARFEARMVEGGKGEKGKKVLKSFKAPDNPTCGGHTANSFNENDTYDPGTLPPAYPKPVPDRKRPNT